MATVGRSDDEGVIRRGGADIERLYLVDGSFGLPDGMRVEVARTDIPGIDNEDLIARHKGRYALLGLYCRPGYRLLDVACGSGYASELLRDFGIEYEGWDVDGPTVEFARRTYGREGVYFSEGDLRSLDFGEKRFDVIACVETIEHLEMEHHAPIVESFFRALKLGGTLVISSPEAIGEESGASAHNPYHLCELTRSDFRRLVGERFGSNNVELVTHEALLSNGVWTTCLYGVCHRRPDGD